MIDNVSQYAASPHQCIITKVYSTGLVDARSITDDVLFTSINKVTSGANYDLNVKDTVLVISDGAQHYVMGKIEMPIRESGINNFNGDLGELSNSKFLVARDDFGNLCRVVVDPGAGVILDTGERCVVHMDPGKSQINTFAQNKKEITFGSYCETLFDPLTRTCSTHICYKTVYNPKTMDDEFDDKIDRTLDLGATLSIDISSGEPFAKLTARKLGIEGVGVEIDSTGKLDASVLQEINLSASLGNIEINTLAGKIKVTSSGQVYIGNKVGVNLLGIINQMLTLLQSSTTLTVLGPQPLIPFSGGAAALITQLQIIKGSLT